jgi:hypothetical protein
MAYLIPGRGERMCGALGSVLQQEGREVRGRALRGDFLRLRFPDQLAAIGADLEEAFWHPDGLLVGRSYGAYLLLHALAERPPFPGRALLFSPVLGVGVRPDGRFGSRPPRATRLRQMAREGTLPLPRCLEVHAGAEDEGCDPALAEEIFSDAPGVTLAIVPQMGHELDPAYVWRVARRFLAESE